MESRTQPTIRTSHGRCPYCHDKVELDDRVACAACLAAHHQACWSEHLRCATCAHEAALSGEGPRLLSTAEVCDALGISPAELEVLFFKHALSAHRLPSGARGIDPEDVVRVRPHLNRLLDLHRAQPRSHLVGSATRGWFLSLCLAVPLVAVSALLIGALGPPGAVPVVLLVAYLVRYLPPLA